MAVVMISSCLLVLFFPSVIGLNVFSPPNGQKLEKMITHPTSGAVYVAAVNAVYQLTKNLATVEKYTSGPKVAGDSCLPRALAELIKAPSEACPDGTASRGSHTHLMILNKNDNTLIICNSVDDGTCNLHDASHISEITVNSSEILKKAKPSENHYYFSILAPVVVSTSDKPSSSAVIVSTSDGDPLLVVATRRRPTILSPLVPLSVSLITVRSLNETEPLRPLARLPLPYWSHASGDYYYPRQSFVAFPYVYFTSIQQAFPSKYSYTTILSRVCVEDKGIVRQPLYNINRLKSYMEASIACQSLNGTTFEYLTAQTVIYPGASLRMILNVSQSDGVFIAAFARQFNSIKDKEGGPSAVCMFLLTEMEQQFRVEEDRCRAGNGTMFLPREFSAPLPHCSYLKTYWSNSTCSPNSNSPFFYYDQVKTQIQSQSLWHLPSVVTSTASTVVGNRTVLFLGTDEGRIVKLSIDDRFSASFMEEIPLAMHSSSAILSNGLSLTNDSQYIYVLFSTKVVKVEAENCSVFSVCSECVKASDSLCGFCVLENKCSLRSNCNTSSNSMLWLQKNDSQCIAASVTNMQSHTSYITSPQQIAVKMLNVPAVGSYGCVFGDLEITAAVRRNCSSNNTEEDVFDCWTPALGHLPGGKVNMTVQLSFVSLETNIVLVENVASVHLYHCQLLQICSECNQYPCGWCEYNSLCTDTHTECRNKDQRYLITNASSCPRLEGRSYFIPSGLDTWNLTLQAENLPSPDVNDTYECHLLVNSEKMRFVTPAARLSASLLSCIISQFAYSSNYSSVASSLAVFWNAFGLNQSYVIETTAPVELTAYKCRLAAATCSVCVDVKEEMLCGWCHQSRQCVVQRQCTGNWTYENPNTCPRPIINTVYPLRGPVEGGTVVTIEGKELGITFSDVKRVLVGGVDCLLVSSEYKPGTRIVCITNSTNSSGSGNITVWLTQTGAVTYDSYYEYLIVRLFAFSPTRGPRSGGTLLKLRGTNLDVGVTITVAGILCNIIEGSSRNDTLFCRTERLVNETTAPSSWFNGSVQVTIDDAIIESSTNFSYTPDPTITEISPSTGLASGGIPIKVKGNMFLSIQQPSIVFLYGNVSYTAVCDAPGSETLMVCPQPPVMVASDVDVTVTFVLDSVPRSGLLQPKPFTVRSDPQFHQIDFNPKRSDFVIINGSNLDVADKRLYRVFLNGDIPCTVTVLDKTSLYCKPEDLECSREVEREKQVYPLQVTVGAFNRTIGDVNVNCNVEDPQDSYSLASSIIILVAIISAAVVGCVVIIIVKLSARRRPRTIPTPRANTYEKGEELALSATNPLWLLEWPEYEGYQLDRDSLTIIRELGSGEFGMVYLASMKGKETSDEDVTVAVKTMKKGGSREKAEEFKREMELMMEFNHPHIVTLIGVCTADEPVYIVTELMDRGDLKQFLIKCRSDGESDAKLSLKQLLIICEHVASAVAYLASHRYVHRDIAARNCLVKGEADNNFTVKLADFGMSKDIYQEDYYKKLGGVLPIRWMSPEAILDGRYTLQSDVWSLAVVMWEIVSFGRLPYYGMSNKDVLSGVCSGSVLLSNPSSCPESLYNLMTQCWHKNPEDRPAAQTIHDQIDDIVTEEADYFTVDVVDASMWNGDSVRYLDMKPSSVPMFKDEILKEDMQMDREDDLTQ